jgi:septal ring factor EnvC (AmiA/AmiB activator)
MIKIDFEKFNEIGLKPITDAFEKAGLPVASVEATNKPKRESGFQTKTAIFEFESGQKLHLKGKANGSIFQVKLNAMAIPVKNVDDLDKAVKEVIAFVEKNEPEFLKRKEKQLEALKIKVPTIKTVRTSVVKQTEQLTAALETVNEAVAEAVANKAEINTAVADKRATVEDLQRQLTAENAMNDRLQAELDRLQEAAA